MQKNKKRLFWALLLLLLFLPPCYYFKSSFVGQKAQLERERLLVRRQISEPLLPTGGEGEEVDTGVVEATDGKGVSEPSGGEMRIPQVPKLEGRKEEFPKRIEAKKEKKVGVEKKEIVQRERKPLVQRPPAGEEVRVKPEGKAKRVVRLLRTAALAECDGVPMSHRNLALFLCRELRLGSDLSYTQALMALYGVGISPRAGWSQGDPSFPIGADELEEILSKAENAISIGLVAGDYPELTERLRQYCKGERVYLVEAPQCEGPMVTECEDCEISQGDFAIYLSKVLGIGEALNYDQSFLALAALHISPRRGWRFEEPFALITQREMEEVRCSVQEAYEKGLIETAPTLMVASVNDLCLWLKMDVEVVGAGTVAETVTLTDYQGTSRIAVPKGGIVKSASN